MNSRKDLKIPGMQSKKKKKIFLFNLTKKFMKISCIQFCFSLTFNIVAEDISFLFDNS